MRKYSRILIICNAEFSFRQMISKNTPRKISGVYYFNLAISKKKDIYIFITRINLLNLNINWQDDSFAYSIHSCRLDIEYVRKSDSGCVCAKNHSRFVNAFDRSRVHERTFLRPSLIRITDDCGNRVASCGDDDVVGRISANCFEFFQIKSFDK